MGDALDDLYDALDRQTDYCERHKIWYEELGFGCPHCEIEAEEPETREAVARKASVSMRKPDVSD